MPDAQPVRLSGGLPETVIPEEPAEARQALAAALAEPPTAQAGAIAAVAARWPRSLHAWAHLAERAPDPEARYAYARVGYHRGLDALRGAGWRGSGYCRWSHPSNRGFLRALDQLRRAAEEIGETDEAARCAEFLVQLDPDWHRRDA